VLVVAALAVTCLVALSMALAGDRPLGEIIRDAPLMAFSAQTTTGFSTVDVSGLEPASKLILIVSMMAGGSVGSTAGGMKILRLLILLKMLRLTVLKTCMPQRAVVEPRIEGQRLEDDEIQRALVIILLFGLVVVVSWLPFVAAGHDPLDSLFDVVSAVGTVGLSTGVTSAGLEPVLKGVLCVDMLLGRLEIVAFLVIFYPGNWFGRKVGQR
jgi:trk system potassium uptake protein TrkH